MPPRNAAKRTAEHVDDITERIPRRENRENLQKEQKSEAVARAEAVGQELASPLERIMENQKIRGTVEMLNEQGEKERWRIVNEQNGLLLLTKGARQKTMEADDAVFAEYLLVSSEEAAVAARAAEMRPKIAEQWDRVVTATRIHPAAKNFDFAAHKEAIIEAAALMASEFDPADAAHILNEAVRDALEDYAHENGEDEITRTLAIHDALMALRFDDIAQSERTPAIPITRAPRAPGTGKDIPLQETVQWMSAQTNLRDMPPAARAVGKGEISPIHALETLLAIDTEKMDIEAIDAHLHDLAGVRARIDSELQGIARLAGLTDIQNREFILRAQRATLSEQSLGIVQGMIDELQSRQSANRTVDKPKHVEKLVEHLRLLRQELGPVPRYEDSDWMAGERKAWELEKRILTATGNLEAVKPENYSVLYAGYKKLYDSGTLTKNELLDRLHTQAKVKTMPVHEEEGLHILLHEIAAAQPTAVDAHEEPEVTEEITRKPKKKSPSITLSPEPQVTTSASVSLTPEPRVTTSAANLSPEPRFGKAKEKPTPVEAEWEDDEPIQHKGEFGKGWFEQDPAVAMVYREPYRKITAPFGGPEEFERLFSRLEEAGLAPFNLNELKTLDTLSRGKVLQRIKQIRQAVNQLPEKPKAGWASAEKPRRTSYDQVVEAFGGPELFADLYKKVSDYNTEHNLGIALPTINQLKTEKLNVKEFIGTVRTLADQFDAFEGRDSRVREITPYEALVDAIGGERALREAYASLSAADKARFDLDKLASLRSLPPENTKMYIDRFREAIAVDKKELAETPYEQVIAALGGSTLFDTAYRRLLAKNKLPYTKAAIERMKPLAWWERFIPGKLTPEKVIDAFNKAITEEANEEAEEQRKTNTFSGRKGGRGKLAA